MESTSTKRPPKPRLIGARFKGKCRHCGAVIEPGQPVWFAKHYGVRCENCGPHPHDESPLPPKRSTKKRGKSTPRKPRQSSPPGGTLPGAESLKRQARLDPDGVHRVEFDSIGALLADALDDYAQNDHNRERIRATQDEALDGRHKWGNYFTRRKLLDRLAHPDAELLATIESLRDQLVGQVITPTAPRRRVRRGLDWGDELDPMRWLHRDPQGWERCMREPQPRGTITIGCNVAVNCKQTPGELLYRGAAALALADVLTTRGFNVEMVLFKAVTHATNLVSTGVLRCQIKDPLMPMNVADLAFSLCEIAFARSVVICSAVRHWPGKLSGGWGSPASLPAHDRKGIDHLIDRDVTSHASAVDWLNRQLQREVNHV